MDAAVEVYYGVKLGWEDDAYEVLEELRKIEEEKEEKPPWEWKEDEVVFKLMTPSEGSDVIGFGSTLYYHDWDSSPITFDEMTREVNKDIERVKEVVDRVLDEHSVPGKRDVWVFTELW